MTYMNGGTASQVEIILRNPTDHTHTLTLFVDVDDHQLSRDWVQALRSILINQLVLEKNYCWLGWPWSHRNLDYLCAELNQAVAAINDDDLVGYLILERYSSENISDEKLNQLHYHFEQLQGTVENPSRHYAAAGRAAKDAIRKLNLLCHEIESLLISQKKYLVRPEWIRPSTIVTFLHAPRYELTDLHRQLFLKNRYDREFGRIYMHWCQIGKTYYEVWRDEHAPKLNSTICSAITNLRYYSGEFDIEWGRTVAENIDTPWHDRDMQDFRQWLLDNKLSPTDLSLSLGYLPIAKINLERSFGTTQPELIWKQVAECQDIYAIRVDDVSRVYEYSLNNENYATMIKEAI